MDIPHNIIANGLAMKNNLKVGDAVRFHKSMSKKVKLDKEYKVQEVRPKIWLGYFKKLKMNIKKIHKIIDKIPGIELYYENKTSVDWRVLIALVYQVDFNAHMDVVGVVYRMTVQDGRFYIGKTERALGLRVFEHLEESFRSWEIEKTKYRIFEEKLMLGESIEVDVLSNDITQEKPIIQSYHDNSLILNKQFLYNSKGEKIIINN